MTSLSIIAITLLTASALTSAFFAYMHSLRRQAYLMLWSAGWCLLALHYLSPALEPWIAVAPWQSAVNQWLLAAAALLFFSTARVYTEAQPLVRPQIAVGGCPEHEETADCDLGADQGLRFCVHSCSAEKEQRCRGQQPLVHRRLPRGHGYPGLERGTQVVQRQQAPPGAPKHQV